MMCGFVLAVECFPCVPGSVARARRRAAEAYAAYPLVDAFAVGLLVSEAATNAVVHAASGGDFYVLCHAPASGTVQIEVHDGGRGAPVRRCAAGLDEHGRGLELLDLLAAGWRTEPTAHGKSLIFTLGEGPHLARELP
ncbi:ATP-binding protein [Streptomyces daliensis]|uniref:ATP-binding protein n=1 Tax=Streptomyces daliensis TaxID=299421 RepID=A0A8T4IVX5_9ACTN|nr:ATP-binding protein [Streptomyces daliensis]